MLLTRLPAGTLPEHVPSLAEARWAFPIVGALIGALVGGVHGAALAVGLPAGAAAVVALAAAALVTGALHFDGLADFADGIGGGRDKDHCLDIMRDSRIGSYGVLALILAIGLWGSALAALGTNAGLGLFVLAGALSRSGMVVLQAWLPNARSDGLGASAAGNSLASLGVAAGVAVLCLLVLGWSGLCVLVVGLAASVLVGALAKRRIGGQTGDVLGAAQVLSEAAIWTSLAALI